MFDKIKSTVMTILGIEAFNMKDGKVLFSDEDKAQLKAQFGDDFIQKFSATLEKELADTSAQDQAASMKKLMESMKAENARQIEANKVAMQKELAEKLAAKAAEYNAKIAKLSGDAEPDQKPEENTEGGKKVDFKINAKHRHNVYAKAMMGGGLDAEVMMAGDTIDVDDLKTEFGTFISQKDKPILKALTQPTETMKHMTTKVAITEWRASRALIDSVVQQFSSKWTPLGASDFTPMTIKNYRHKINVPITPDEINDSWLSHLYDESLTPEQMPITKYIINELILPKVEEDRELKLIANGVYTEFGGAPATGDAGQATGLSMEGFMTQLVKLYETKASNNVNFIAVGPITTSNIVDKVESFVDSLDPLYARKSMNIFCGDTFYKGYKRAYRDLFPTTKNDDKSDMVDYSLQKLQPLPSMAGYGHFFTTPKENFVRLIHKNQGANKIWMQAADYDVKVFAEWWEGVGFAIQEAIYVYIDALHVISDYAVASDASKLQTYMLTDAGCTDVNADNLADYKTAIAAENSIASLAALQTIVDTVNAA